MFGGEHSAGDRVVNAFDAGQIHKASRASDQRAAREAQTGDGLVAAFRYGARAVQLQLHLWFFRMKFFPARPAPMLSRARQVDGFDLLFAYQSIRIAAEYLSQAYGDDCFEDLAEVL